MRLTDKIVRNLPVPAKGKPFIRDSEVTGFGVRLTPNGNRSFAIKYARKSDGVERYLTIGEFGPWEVSAAREQARRFRRDIDSGGDPLGQRENQRSAPTVAELCTRFEEEHLSGKRQRTQESYRQAIRTHVIPTLGTFKVSAVTFDDVKKLHRRISNKAPTQANRVAAILCKMFNLSIRWGMRSDNPCKGVERNSEHKRIRYMKGDELQRLTAALQRHDNQQAANVIRLLLLTGARKGEVLAARWDQFDLRAGVWTKPGATVKQKTTHVVPLSKPALELLRSLPRRSDYVFPATRSDATTPNQNNITGAWAVICRDAGIKNLRIHDLRHHFASVLASSGYSLPIIGQLLGHTQAQTTARYSHLFDDVQREAAEAAGAIIVG